jgi:hypothetical protein
MKQVTDFAGPRRPWLRCASSKTTQVACVDAPCHERRWLAEIDHLFHAASLGSAQE